MCDANNIYNAFLASIKGSKWKEQTQVFALNFLRGIFSIKDDLEHQAYKPGSENIFTLSERGKVRPITSLNVRDRIVRHALCDEVLMPEIRPRIIYDNSASIKGRGLDFARRRFESQLHAYYRYHGNNGYILFGDFRKFYDNIVHDKAKEALLKPVNNDSYISWLLDVLFKNFEIDVSYMSDDEYSNCLNRVFDKLKYRSRDSSDFTGEKFMKKSSNIGDQLAQMIGIWLPNKLDSYVKTVKGIPYYGRYNDDWWIIAETKEELWDLLKDIQVILDELGIILNEKKTRIVPINKPFTFLQIRYSGLSATGKIYKRANPKRVTAERTKLKKYARMVNDGIIPYTDVENQFRSWMGSFYKLLSKESRNNLITLYEKLFDKKVEVRNGKLFCCSV